MTVLRVDRFAAGDLAGLRRQAAQPELAGEGLALCARLGAGGRAFTARDAATGAVLLCGGIVEAHPGYATLWSAVSADAGPAMVALTRRVRWFAASLPHRRVDAMARASHAAARRWLELIGFRLERDLPDAFEDGDAAMIYRWQS